MSAKEQQPELKEGGDTEEEYDPHLHRVVEKPTTYLESLAHFLKGCLGTGILAMPQAFMFSGMVNGIVSTIIIGILTTYCFHVLVRSQYILCKKMKVPLLTFPESMKTAFEIGPAFLNKFSRIAPDITNFFLLFNQIGTCCVYVVFIAVNIKDVVEIYEDVVIIKEVYIACLFVPFILILCLPDLKILAPFSLVANIITIITFIVVAYYVCQNLKTFTDLPAFGTLFNYPLYFGTTLFAIQSIGVITAVENNMKNPKQYVGTFGLLNVGMFIVTSIYVIMAMLGYWRFGDEIEDSITLNFPRDDILGHVVKLMYSMAIFISYGLQGFVAIYILWHDYCLKCITTRLRLWEYVLRIATVFLTVALAATVPLLGLFISLVGAFCLSALCIMFPAIMEICALWHDGLGRYNWILIKNIFLVFIGLVGLFSGSFSAIYSIVNALAIERQ